MKAENRIPKQYFLEGEFIEDIFRRAVQHALLQHKRVGNTIAAWEDGRVVLIPAEEIQIEVERELEGTGLRKAGDQD